MLQPGLTAAIALFAASPAFGHAHLERASPQQRGGTVSSAPPELALTFSEQVEPLFSTIELRDAHNVRIDTGKPKAAPGNPPSADTQFAEARAWDLHGLLARQLGDTHKTEGRFTFTVVP